MHSRIFNLHAIGRAVGIALVAAAIVAAALHFRHDEPRLRGQARPAGSDPLSDELNRCQVLAAQAKDDAACETAWAKSRRRFLTYQPAAAASKTSDR